MSVRQPRILMYHTIASLAHDPNKLCVSPQRFEAQMLYLKKHNLRGVSIRELRRLRSIEHPRNLVGITFDDGYRDFLRTAVPILESFDFSATVFVVVGLLGKDNRWKHAYHPTPRMELLGATELRDVTERGMEVGSHSMTHANLAGLDSRMLDKEVRASRQVLSDLLGEEVEGFCFPYGSMDPAAVDAARQAGYAYACGWRTPLEHGYGTYNLPRIYMSGKDNNLRVAAKLRVYSRYSAITQRFKRR